MNKTVVTSGVDSEYVLGSLCENLRKRGCDVFELDFGKFSGNAEQLLAKLMSKKVAYVTSAHTNLTLRVAEQIVPLFVTHFPNYLAPLEIIPKLKPSVSIYVPHDLLTPYGDANLNEFRYLNVFDHVLAPYGGTAMQGFLGAQTKVHDAGWIKNVHNATALTSSEVNNCKSFRKSIADRDLAPNRCPRVTLFISMIEHLRMRYGIDGLVNYLQPLLRSNMRIKLPAWSGVKEIEQRINDSSGIEVVSSQVSSVDLIRDSDVIVCNSASSIHAEASLLGIPTICILDDEGISCDEQRKKLKAFPSIWFHDYRHRESLSDKFICKVASMRRAPNMKAFDFDLIYSLIDNST